MFSTLLTGIHLNDVADVLILSILLYRLLLLMRGTRAFQMAWGLALLIPANIAARWFELKTLSWILDRFSVYVVLAIIILFQDDIRRALARVGNPFFASLSIQMGPQIVDELVRAVFALAAGNVGALIALEREGSLEDYVEVGVRVDALVTQQLLQAIFQVTSPIHDGAVIIQKNRIAAAGCFLPLTRNLEVSKALGTRHRAAIGVTDETDAIVLVVSEEEGRVSLVQGGRIRVVPDPDTLTQALGQIYSLPEPRTRFRLRRPR